ncbi:MAG TPA: hypothetical protein VFH51_16275, partial [Myxococcota bacterium]|nr:hypothetical protein [Myxococcota bacterium]
REFFPDIADEVGPLMENEATGVAVADAARRSSQAWEEDNRSRVRLTATLVLVVLAGGGGLFYAVRSLHLFEGAVKIRTQTLQGVRLPVYFPSPAVAVQPVQETWLGFGSPGKVSDLPAVGSRVLQGEILAALDLPPKVNAQMKLAHEGVRRAEADYEKVAKILEKVISEHQAAQAERADAEARVKNARPKSLLKQDPAAKKELETWKKALAKANKKLSLITKRERAPRALEAKAKKKVDLAHKKLAALQSKLGTKLLRAPFAGEVTELKAKAGDDIKADDPVIHLRDPIVARLTFSLKGKVGLQPGGEAMVSVQRGNPVAAKVVSVAEAHGAMEVSVDISDPAGTLVGMNADAFRLVQEFADPAFKVRPGAIIKTDDGARLLLVAHGHANRTAVQVLEEAAGDVVVRDLAGGLRSEAVVVVARSDAQAVDTVPEGAAVETEGDGGAKP